MKLHELKKKTLNHNVYKPLFKLERKLNYKQLIVFSVVAIALMVLTIGLFSLVEDVLSKMIVAFGEANREMLEQMMGSNDFSTYFHSQALQGWALIGVMYGSVLGCRLISSNFKDKSQTMLYSLNLTRNQILTSKLIRLSINSLIYNVSVGGISAISVLAFGHSLNFANLVIFILVMYFIVLLSGLFSFALSAMTGGKISTVISVVIPIGLMFLASLSSINSSLEFLVHLSPMQALVKGKNLAISSGFAGVNFITLLVWFVVDIALLVWGYLKFNKKDLV